MLKSFACVNSPRASRQRTQYNYRCATPPAISCWLGSAHKTSPTAVRFESEPILRTGDDRELTAPRFTTGTGRAYGGIMKRKLFVVGVGVSIGYLLGSHAGRERYDWMKAKAVSLWENPRVAKTRHDVEAYARQQAPIIRERAEAATRAAPGIAHDVTAKVSETAKEVADRTAAVAKVVADKTVGTARDVADKTVSTARDVAEKANDVGADVLRTAEKVASDLRERGETAVDNAVATAGEARDEALDVLDDEDDPQR